MSFEAIAELLTFELDDIEADDWQGAEIARIRSSISRSYYAVLRRIKRVTCNAYPTLDFPEKGVHGMIPLALTRAQMQELRQHFNDLSEARKLADYDLVEGCRYEVAEDSIDRAHTALDLIDRLTPAQCHTLAVYIESVKLNWRF